jgi:hypothetical protein
LVTKTLEENPPFLSVIKRIGDKQYQVALSTYNPRDDSYGIFTVYSEVYGKKKDARQEAKALGKRKGLEVR